MKLPPVNSISADQNSDKQIQRLAAATAIYSRAKLILALQVVLTVVGGAVSAIVVAKVSGLKVWVASYSFGVALLDALVLEPEQSELRKMGAKVQEIFDCELLCLPWRKLVTGDHPDRELVVDEAAKYNSKHPDLSGLRDWYPVAVSRVSLPIGRLICQRSNPWWDFTLRGRYRLGLKVILWSLGAFVFAIAIYTRLTIGTFVLAVLAPLTPAILWGTRELRKQTTAIEALGKLKEHIGDTWNAALEGTLKDELLDQASIEIQNEIYRSRAQNPLIFNWVNGLLRNRQQKSMNDAAEEMVAEALSKRAQA